ncbi:unnamed protein product [Cochlearia groenlandica]
MKARSRKGSLVAILVVFVYCFFEYMSKCSMEVSLHEHVGSYINGGFFALDSNYNLLKSLPSTNEFHKRLATVEIWETVIRSKCRDGFIGLSIKSMHFFVSKLMQFKYSISVVTPTSRAWTSRIVFWVTLTRAVSSMANDTVP